MNNIQEMDWADDRWHGHTGMDSSCDYCKMEQETATASLEAEKEEGKIPDSE